ncbi:hypothetical protein AGOR_G00117280, partial [Albula goreensis]
CPLPSLSPSCLPSLSDPVHATSYSSSVQLQGPTHRLQVSVMAQPTTVSLGLLLILIGQALTGPQSDPPPRTDQGTACQEHSALHDRLDVVEKRVEDTVQKLEAELSLLLDAIEAPEWSPLLVTGTPVIDILDSKVEEATF